MKLTRLDRRAFIEQTGKTVSAGLFFSYSAHSLLKPPMAEAAIGKVNPNVFVGIHGDGLVEIVCHRSEMGQGVRTSLPMIIAEELGADYDKIKVTQAVGDKKYGDQNTDGSTSIREHWQVLREAGAAAREMLIAAAAKNHGHAPKELKAEEGFVVHTSSNKKYAFKDLLAEAAKQPVPKKPQLKSPSQFKIVGRSQKMHDLPDIIKGQAHFGIDIVRKGMVYASIERSPVKEGQVKSFDKKAAMAVKGVKDVVKIDAIGPDVNSNAGVAVVADNSWVASKGREKLNVQWDLSRQSFKESTKTRDKAYKSALSKKKDSHRSQGKAPKGAKKLKVGGPYRTPYLVHSPMEPLVCVAEVKKGACEVWAPVQHPQRIQASIAKHLKIKPENVTVNITLLGGGFGRKSQPDFVLEAVEVARQIKKPVKLQWSREDEIKHGFYHADSMQNIEVAVDAKAKKIVSWKHNTSFPTIMTVFNEKAVKAAPWEVGMGALEFPYDVPHVEINHAPIKTSVRIGWLRAVCHVWHAFAINSCLDEVAASFKEDPIDFRLRQLGKDRVAAINPREKDVPYKQHTGRLAGVIKTLKRNISWQPKKGKNRGMGFAAHYGFHTYVATAVDASVENGEIKVHQVDVAVDAGTIVNPDSVRAQMEGAVIFGLSAAMHGKITLTNGVVDQSNFHDYPVLRHNEAPKINVFLVNNGELPTGVGEPGVPPVAPALTAAIYQAIGKRVTTLPLVDQKLS